MYKGLKVEKNLHQILYIDVRSSKVGLRSRETCKNAVKRQLKKQLC